MSRRSFLLDLKAEGALALWHDYRRGDAQDMSGNGNDGVLGAGVALDRWGAEFTSVSGLITVADSASLQLTALTIAVFGTFPNITAGGRLVSKRDGGGNNYEFGTNSTTSLFYFDSASASRTISASPIGRKYLAVSATNGAIPVGYRDGISVGNFSGTATITVNDAPLIVGGLYTGGLRHPSHIGAVVIANRILTATEHAKLYGELANQDWGQRVL